MADINANQTPQFHTAEYLEKPRTDVCKFCSQPVTGQYYRFHGEMACRACTENVRASLPADSHSGYARAVLFGVGAAIAGLILYATFEIVTGLIIGYLSLAVGYMIGKAMKAGSNGAGGRRYQVTAALLTYAAVSLAAIPVALVQLSKHPAAHPQANVEPKPSDAQPEPQPESAPTVAPNRSFGAAVAWLALLGLASPFLELQDPLQGLIGLVILLVGIRIAWKTTAGGPPGDSGTSCSPGTCLPIPAVPLRPIFSQWSLC